MARLAPQQFDAKLISTLGEPTAVGWAEADNFVSFRAS